MALYLKYRPQNLDQLIGQESVKKTLLNAFSAGKLSHAYLFVGPRGTGKTSTARILAKMVNCEKKDGLIPCNECSTCLAITDGSFMDLIEIDAASNRGIDDIRALRETIKLAPSFAQKKVYIIDEVHMLTTEAFNALLKTLEEPPAHALFILATTEASKVPQTILSRVQRLDFKLATSNDLITALRRVADGEKIKVTDDVLKLVSKKADGSFRDGVKLFDQLSGSGELTPEVIESLLQNGDFTNILELLESLSKKDGTQALSQIVKFWEGGTNIKSLTLNIMDILRSLVFIKNGLGNLTKEEYGSGRFENLVTLAEKFTIPELVKNLKVLQAALEDQKTSSIPSLPLELAIVEICNPAVFKVIETETITVAATPVKSQIVVQSSASESSVSTPIETENSSTKDDSQSEDIIKLQEKWTFVLETIRQYNFSLEALLRSVKIAECSGGVVVLEVPYSFHQRILETPKSRDVLESILSDILNKSIKVTTVLGQRPQRLEDIANVELAADDEIVTMASEIFSGELVEAD